LVVAAKTVPVGSYTLQMLDKLSADATFGAGFKDAVLKNVVSQENNVRAVLSKVGLGEADAGVVYSTDSQSAADKVTNIDVPDAYNVIALYPIAVVNDAPNASLANAWIAYVLSAQGQAILAKYGFVPPS
jgi:molybdate transport system substrate-binding protein